jgi:hypothetical protein
MEYISYVKKFANKTKRQYPWIDGDQIESDMLLAFVLCTRKYKQSGSTFSIYLTCRLKGCIKDLIRRDAKRRFYSLCDVYADKSYSEEAYLVAEQEIYAVLNDYESMIVRLMQRKSRREVCAELGICSRTLYRYMNLIREAI